MNSGLSAKFGFNVFDQPPEDFFEYASDKKLKHIEINLTGNHSILQSFDNKRIRKLKKLAAENKIKLSIHLPYTVNISDIIGPIRNGSITYLKECILFASKIKATHITAHIGSFYWFPFEKYMRRKALHRFLKYLREILLLCEMHNVKIALENVVPIPQGSEFYLLGDNIEDFKYIFENVDSKHLKFCLDTGHANMGEGVISYINNFYDKLISVHFHDNKGTNDEHLPVGKGTVPWLSLAEELEVIKYRGPLVSECRNINPHEAAELFQSYFNIIKNQTP